MEIDINDAAGRIHTIPILFDEAAASIGQLRIVSIKLDAPCAELKHFSSNVDFERIEAELKRMIDAYQPFWDNFDEIDRQAFVVDGLGRSSCKRKIALGDNCFLHIEVADPLYPTELPSIRISGPEANTRPLEFKVVTNRKLWNTSKSLLSNLETLLETKLPAREQQSKEDKLECGICLADLDSSGSSPANSCLNEQCSYLFHNICLVTHFATSHIPHNSQINNYAERMARLNSKSRRKAWIHTGKLSLLW